MDRWYGCAPHDRDLVVVFPVLASQLRGRATPLNRVYADLAAAARTGGPLSGATFLAWVNGPEILEWSPLDLVRWLPPGVQSIRVSAVADKVRAVNEAIAMARALNWRRLVICDNDVRVPVTTAAALVRAFDRYSGRRTAVCEKLGLVTPKSTPFQREFSAFANHVITRRLIPNRRPSGSLYILDPRVFPVFPDGANEGDFLTTQPISHTDRYIYSEYPQSLDMERQRRVRLTEASDRIGFRREIQDPGIFEYWMSTGSIVDGIRSGELLASAVVFGSVMAPELVPDIQCELVGLELPPVV